ncbi:MAG: HEAT repeat domain-containing protein [Pirellulaceae bacterium]
MKSHACTAITLLLLALSHRCLAAEPNSEALDKFGRNLAVAKVYQFGQDSTALLEIEQLVCTLPRDSQARGVLEQQLIVALQTATTKDAKDFLCRQLRVIGTASSVPGLEPLLVDPEVSPMAVYALGYLEAPEAGQAMQRALAKTSGATQAGIINALADRRYQEAKPDLLPLLGSADGLVAGAAARALGRLGGADALAALQGARAAASPELAVTIDNALLQSAEGLAAAGALDQAAAVYESIRISQPTPTLELAALRGLVLARPADAARLLVQAMGQDNAESAASAIAMIDLVPGPAATKAFVELVKSLPPASQVLLLRALGNRGDATASSAICEAARSTEEPVRIAALEALGKAGDAEAITTLTAAAAADGDAKRVARASLLLVPGAAVDQRLLALVDKSSEGVRVEAIDALAGRAVIQAMTPLLKTCHDEQAPVRQAAIRAVGFLAAPSDLPALLQLVVQPKSPDDRSLLVAAVGRLLARCADKDQSCAFGRRAKSL